MLALHFSLLVFSIGHSKTLIPFLIDSHDRLAVTRAVQNLRRGYEDYMAGQEEEPSEEEKRKVTTSMMPEYVLPYMLHLLAHFPDYPTSKQDMIRWKPILKYVKSLSSLGTSPIQHSVSLHTPVLLPPSFLLTFPPHNPLH